MSLNRRDFLVVSAGAGGALHVGLGCGPRGAPRGAPVDARRLHPLLELHTDGTVVVLVTRSEMGQGIATALPMLLAEEMDVDWSAVRVETERFEPAHGDQVTTASVSVFESWTAYREAGALARRLIVAAAAKEWGVPAERCSAAGGVVSFEERRITYGEIAVRAASLPQPPSKPALKPASAFQIVGRPVGRVDTPVKVSGTAVFGLDVAVPGMRIATVLRPPLGARVARVDDAAALRVPGVERVVRIRRGVAVVARDTWSALRGRDQLSVEWSGEQTGLDSAAISARLRRELDRPGHEVKRVGDVNAGLASATRTIEAIYDVPFLAHATMEPMNCTAHVEHDRCTVWAPTQAPGWNRRAVAELTGLPAERVEIHRTFLGGGFGRRSHQDFVTEAVEISRAVRKPVKVVWTRTDDLQNDFYRPTFLHRMRGGIDRDGAPVAWEHRLAGPSVIAWWAGAGMEAPRDVDGISVAGSERTLYRVPNFRTEARIVETGVPVGIWRSIAHSHTNFVNETFIDELAAAAGRDPLRYRLDHLRDAPRVRAVLEMVAERSGWDRPVPGRHRGVALFGEDEDGYSVQVAQVVEVSIAGGKIRVHRVVTAIDCGMVVNPNIVRAQIEGGVVWGLSSALKEKITIERGRVAEANFDTYRVLRMNEMPEVEVHIAPSQERPGGVGEKGAPAIAPAMANAVFAATGKRLRSLPLRLEA